MKFLFDIIINLLATVIQIVIYPINLIITNALPDISNQLLTISSNISSVFSGISWGLGLLPPGILGVLTFIISVEIAKHTIYVSTHTLIKVWNLFQKLKFW